VSRGGFQACPDFRASYGSVRRSTGPPDAASRPQRTTTGIPGANPTGNSVYDSRTHNVIHASHNVSPSGCPIETYDD